MNKKIFTLLVGAGGFVSGFFICKAVNKARNKCQGVLHIYKLTPDQPEEVYSEFYLPVKDISNRKTIVLKIKKGV